MKLIIYFLLAITVIVPNKSEAFFDSFWLEPSLLCVAGGVGGYYAASSGNEGSTAAIGCAVGGLIGYVMNSHYEKKFNQGSQRQIDDLKRTIEEFEAMMAQKTLKEEDERIGIRVREMVPGERHPDGSVTAPTYRERLVLPGEGVRLGK